MIPFAVYVLFAPLALRKAEENAKEVEEKARRAEEESKELARKKEAAEEERLRVEEQMKEEQRSKEQMVWDSTFKNVLFLFC